VAIQLSDRRAVEERSQLAVTSHRSARQAATIARSPVFSFYPFLVFNCFIVLVSLFYAIAIGWLDLE
jgi:hypothetical protein